MLEISRRKDVGDRYLAHQLMIGDFRITVTLAANASGIEVSWRGFPHDQAVRPDAFFGFRYPSLPEGRNRAFFFLEADRSAMPRGRFLAKLHAYQAWQRLLPSVVVFLASAAPNTHGGLRSPFKTEILSCCGPLMNTA